jgi:2-succinyl-5-enolpyruvyl-6-hydroxy-3-cyclohexene-1-carboxylate synthase
MSDAAGLRAFVDGLVAAGIEQAVVCPGSRSTPLALAIRTTPQLTTRVLIDERAAGFFALGMARTSGRPVVLLATSGTAVVNFAPAVVEAQLSRVPLVVLTADRPPELQDRGAAQTIDQRFLYGRAAKWYAELPLMDGQPATMAHLRSVAGRAVAMAAAGPAGPVHVNVPLREPLLPDASLAPGAPQPPFVSVIPGMPVLDDEVLGELATLSARTVRGLIVAGPDDDPELPEALVGLSRATGYPILADPLSGLRAGPHDKRRVITRADQIVRPGVWIDRHPPDLVIRTGAMPTSKPVLQLLERTRPAQIVLDGDGGWREPALLPTTFVHADPAATARALTVKLGSNYRTLGWTREWQAAEKTTVLAMRAWARSVTEPFEGAVIPALAEALPDGSVLWAGSSMPVRDLDAWFPATDKRITIRSNRGANGIDGVVSSALGAAAVSAGPVALVVGDVSFLHDLNALLAAKLHGLSATIVLLNNDGGGIFSFLPQAQPGKPVAGSGLPEHYEELFGTPHGVDVAPIVTALGGEHHLVTGTADLAASLEDSLGRPGVQVLELRTSRQRNLVLHRGLAEQVGHAVARTPYSRAF